MKQYVIIYICNGIPNFKNEVFKQIFLSVNYEIIANILRSYNGCSFHHDKYR